LDDVYLYGGQVKILDIVKSKCNFVRWNGRATLRVYNSKYCCNYKKKLHYKIREAKSIIIINTNNVGRTEEKIRSQTQNDF